MPANAMAETLDAVKHGRLRSFTGWIDPLLFQMARQRFCNGMVPTVSPCGATQDTSWLCLRLRLTPPLSTGLPWSEWFAAGTFGRLRTSVVFKASRTRRWLCLNPLSSPLRQKPGSTSIARLSQPASVWMLPISVASVRSGSAIATSGCERLGLAHEAIRPLLCAPNVLFTWVML